MCGIAGAAGHLDASTIVSVARASQALVHRGPDASGEWQSAPTGAFEVALAHRRLAIIDTSAAGIQPMRDPESGCVIVFNGEVYNYRELRQELEAAGHAFTSQTDTEVILRAVATWGIGSVARFHGIFAFALWDPRTRALHLVRDQMGIKPLYWSRRGDTVHFASEVRALLADGTRHVLSDEGIASFLWHGVVAGPATIVDGVFLLPAGTYMTISEDNLTPTPLPYWRLPSAAPGTVSLAELEHVLEDVVGSQMVSDVPLGVFLSGGIDSSSLAALACNADPGVVRTFNIGFDDVALDESRFAAAVADALGTDHVSLRVTEGDFQRQLPDALAAIDQPTFDGINTYLVSRAVRDAGMTVALAGTGGDELFGGYTSFVDLPRAIRLPRLPTPFAAVPRTISRVRTHLSLRRGWAPAQVRRGKLADVVANVGRSVGLYQTSYALFTQAMYERLCVGMTLRDGLTDGQRGELESLVDKAPPLHAISMLEMSSFLRERLMRDTDAASMAASIEVRVPLLDDRVVRAVAGLSERDRFLPIRRKDALRRTALRRLDPALFERPKAGFELPIDRWSRNGLREQIDEVFRDGHTLRNVGIEPAAAAALWRSFLAGRPGIYWSRVWAIYVLVSWCRRHGVWSQSATT